MMNSSVERFPQRYARVGGLLYLAIIVLGLFGEMFVRGPMVMSGDAVATAQNILAQQGLWRSGIAGDLLMQMFDLPVILALYVLLRPVSEPLALFATLTNLIQTAVLALNKLNLMVPIFLLGDAEYLKAFSPEQLQALAYVAIKTHNHGFAFGLVFFGVACLARGILVYQSGYLPKFLGVLMFLAGLSYLLNSFALILAPDFASALFPAVLVPAFVGELAFSLWLLVKGVDVAKWEARLT